MTNMYRYGYVVIVYCGMRCNPLCRDEYGQKYRWVEFDPQKLREAVIKIDRRTAAEIIKKIREQDEWEEWYTNVCNAHDCARNVARKRYEFEKQLLETLGVTYVERECSTCGGGECVVDFDYPPSFIIVDAIYERFPDLLDDA